MYDSFRKHNIFLKRTIMDNEKCGVKKVLEKMKSQVAGRCCVSDDFRSALCITSSFCKIKPVLTWLWTFGLLCYGLLFWPNINIVREFSRDSKSALLFNNIPNTHFSAFLSLMEFKNWLDIMFFSVSLLLVSLSQ